MKKMILVFTCLLLSTVCQGRIITVDDDGPADFNNIQAAIDDANDGDTIIVEKGTYFENINFDGKNIVLRSTDPNNPDIVAATILDGNNFESVVTFAGTENQTCVLSGFTIQDGSHDGEYSRGGGGICGGLEENHTRATVRNNIITRNSAWDGGGLSRCDGLIEKNIITNNYARWYQGGGGLDHPSAEFLHEGHSQPTRSLGGRSHASVHAGRLCFT